MAHTISPRAQRDAVLGSLARDFKDSFLEVGCGSRGCINRAFRVGDLVRDQPGASMSELLRLLKCSRCKLRVKSAILWGPPEGERRGIVLRG